MEMGEGLGSSDLLWEKSEGVEASARKLVVERDEEGDLSDEEAVKASDEDALVSTPKAQLLKSDIWEAKCADISDNTRKRSRVDCEREGGAEENNELKEDADNKVEVVRVLRSRSVMKNQGKKEGELEESKVMLGKRTTGDGGFEERVVQRNEDSNGFDAEGSDRSDNEVTQKLKRKRGRPPKNLDETCGAVKESGDRKKEGNDQSAGEETDFPANEVRQKLKRKRGRPPKSLDETCGAVNKSGDLKDEVNDISAWDETEFSENDERQKLKRKRGRPPKSVQDTDGAVKRSDGKKEGNDQSTGEEIQLSYDEWQEKLDSENGRPLRAQESNCSEKERVGKIKESSGQFDGVAVYISESEARVNIKRKRGRPPKVQEESGKKKMIGKPFGLESDKVTGKNLRYKRGRPPKILGTDGYGNKNIDIKKDDINQSAAETSDRADNEVKKELISRRGRPLKVHASDESMKRRVEDSFQSVGEGSDGCFEKVRKKLKPDCGWPPKVSRGIKGSGRRKSHGAIKSRYSVNLNVGNGKSLLGKKYVGTESKAKKVTLARSNNDGNKERESKENTEEPGRSTQKQAVREKIVQLLLGAGWTIEYRPRNGREYQDAVYVNPEGRTHWSITLAYRVLKSHYEDGGGGESDACNTSFKFIPLPDEELSILTKVMGKKRSDANVKKKLKHGKKGGKTAEGVTEKKKKKQKLHKKKVGQQTRKQDGPAGSLDRETAELGRDDKRLKTNGRKPFAMMIRYSKDGAGSDSDGYVLYGGKRTVLAWMVDMGAVPLDGKVQYAKRRKTRTVLKGRITADGIQCDCCSQVFTTSEFETHAGSKSCLPLKNIFLDSGPSLLQCQLDSWHKQDESACAGFHLVDTDGEDPNDDTCGICGDGGDLICCDGCPSTFHQSCLEIKKFPSGVWHCIYCSCKFCGMVGGNPCQDDGAAISPVLTCSLCEEKYHQSCVQAKDASNVDVSDRSFCGKNCQKLYDGIQMLLGVKHYLEEGYSWTLVRRFDVGSDISLAGMPQKVECNSKVAVASLVMDECFLPMVDQRSGVNLIRNIVYNFGSNFNRLNYSGFLTAILERGDEIVSAATIRVHGNHLAEMPFIGTRHMYRRQGMCRRLVTAIETVLRSLNIEKLVIPAISELRETWTSVFGFEPIEGISKQKMRNMNMMVFPGVDMLQKPLLKDQSGEENVILDKGLTSMKPKEHQTMDEMTNISDKQCLARFDLNFSGESSIPHDSKINGQPVRIESDSFLADGCLLGTSDFPGENAKGTLCLEQSRVICELDVGSQDIVNSLDFSCDVHEQTEVTEHQNAAISGSIISRANETMLEVYASSNHRDVSDMESKLPVESHVGSEGTACGGEFFCASKDGLETVNCDVKIEGSNVKCSRKSLAGDLMHTTSEISTTQPQDVAFESESRVSDRNAVQIDSGNRIREVGTPPNQHDVSDIESKLSVASRIGSDATDCRGEFPCALKDGLETGHYKVKIEDSGVKCGLKSLSDLMQTTHEISSKPLDLAFEHELEVSDKNAVQNGSDMSNVDHDVVQSTSSMVHPRAEGTMNGYSAALPVDCNNCSCHVSGPGSHKVESDFGTDNHNCNSSHLTAFDVVAKPSLPTAAGNGLCMSAGLQ